MAWALTKRPKSIRAEAPGEGRLHPEDVWAMLKRVVCDELDVPPGQVAKDTEFVKDLGVG